MRPVNKKNGRAYIRKLSSRTCRMEPINGYGDIITIDHNNPDEMREWVIFGVVITVCADRGNQYGRDKILQTLRTGY